MTAVEFNALGYGPLVPVVPPGADIAPTSKLKQANAGKAPGIRTPRGWCGCDWKHLDLAPARIDSMGGSIGLRCEKLVAVDLDVRDDGMAELLRGIAVRHLGPTVRRTGEAPKCALLYRCAERMHRQQLHFISGGRKHLVELLGDGQQIVIWGVHAKTRKNYDYEPKEIPPVSELPEVSQASIDAMFNEMEETLSDLGLDTTRALAHPKARRDVVDQESLMGPLERIQEAVRATPNTVESHPFYQDYIRMGYAIKAALPDDPEDALLLYLEWALLWPDNTEESVERDWNSFAGPYQIGADFLYAQARRYGHRDAQWEFEPVKRAAPVAVAVPAAPPAEPPVESKLALDPVVEKEVEYSDLKVAEQVAWDHGQDLRWVQGKKMWYTFRKDKWVESAKGVVAFTIRTCRKLSKKIYREGATEKQLADSKREAKAIESARTIYAVSSLAEEVPSLQAEVDDFDSHPDLLGIPGGVVDLRTGLVEPSRREYLISCSTALVPQAGPTPLWDKFLWETTGGDPALIQYLQRLAGYCLTGHTSEHVFCFFWGDGGNGKSTFLNALAAIMGSHCRIAAMDAFIAHRSSQHPVSIAVLAGSRMVLAQETRPGQHWDETLLKSLTGGDEVSARVLYGQPFRFLPRFKLIFAGNHQPSLSTVGDALRRRIHVVPFVCKPAVVDKALPEKLKAEHPAILAWAIEGARQWHKQGLNPPGQVLLATEEYLEQEDLLGQWIAERCEKRVEARGSSSGLHENWSQWCGEKGIAAGSQVIFSKRLRECGYMPRRTSLGTFWEGLELRDGGVNGSGTGIGF